MPWSDLPETSTFERARRREAYRRFGRAVTGGKKSATLKDLDEVRERLRLFDQTYIGLMPIEVAKIVGTAGRNMEFDKNFLPRRHDVQERWRRLELHYPEGGFPPIVVYKLNDMYFVVDGHHRVAIAKQTKIEYIDAEVTELHPRRALPEGLDLGRVIFAEQERIFLEESGLAEALPDVNIEFSKPDGYPELLELIQMYGYRLMLERNEIVPPPVAAEHWHENIYTPAVEAIRDEKLHELFPRATEADLYLLVHQRRLALFPERGYVSMEDMARELKERETRRPVRRVVRRLTGSTDH
ncbi:MAG: transcriptional regulator [Actinobacteria bacterium]|nr:transcriptional regulator [Actinomycetota bacterium]